MAKKKNDMIEIKEDSVKILLAVLILCLIALIIVIMTHFPLRSGASSYLDQPYQQDTTAKVDTELYAQVLPENGYKIDASVGDLAKQLVDYGVIDLNAFKQLYSSSNPLTDKQLAILTKGSDEKIIIDSDNSYFYLNLFWALGLANKNSILTDGPMIEYGNTDVSNFASTGGWTLSTTSAMNHYAMHNMISLTKQQQKLVELVSKSIYRPCCNNPTYFPDCNHGMAMLGMLQLMAANGATKEEMFEAGKYANAFWFPDHYYDVATYFKEKDGIEFKDLDGEIGLGADYSSASGAQNITSWLTNEGLIQQDISGGSSC